MHVCIVGDPGWRHGSRETACITRPRREVKKTESGREQQPSEVWAFFPGHKFKKNDWWPYLPAPEHLPPSPKAVMATVERLQRGWEHLKSVPERAAGAEPALARRCSEDERVSRSLQGLSQACLLFLSFPCLPQPPFLPCWPPPFVEEWSLVLETLTLVLGCWTTSFTYKKLSSSEGYRRCFLGISQLVSSEDRISIWALTLSSLFFTVWNPD